MRKNMENILSDVELVTMFKQGQEDEVIQYIYNVHHYAFQTVSKRYFGIDEATVESTILEQIWRAIQEFDPARGTKLVTLICTFIKNDLRATSMLNNTYKRKANQANVCSVFSAFETEENDRCFEQGEEDMAYNELEMLELLDTLDLTENQYNYCQCIIQQLCETSMAGIANHLGISRAGALSIKKALQSKLAFLID